MVQRYKLTRSPHIYTADLFSLLGFKRVDLLVLLHNYISGGKEFFRVVPKDNPPAQTFNVEGVQVNVSKPNPRATFFKRMIYKTYVVWLKVFFNRQSFPILKLNKTSPDD
jgi:hypothetical protein